jgi:hypothetical protein
MHASYAASQSEQRPLSKILPRPDLPIHYHAVGAVVIAHIEGLADVLAVVSNLLFCFLERLCYKIVGLH